MLADFLFFFFFFWSVIMTQSDLHVTSVQLCTASHSGHNLWPFLHFYANYTHFAALQYLCRVLTYTLHVTIYTWHEPACLGVVGMQWNGALNFFFYFFFYFFFIFFFFCSKLSMSWIAQEAMTWKSHAFHNITAPLLCGIVSLKKTISQ